MSCLCLAALACGQAGAHIGARHLVLTWHHPTALPRARALGVDRIPEPSSCPDSGDLESKGGADDDQHHDDDRGLMETAAPMELTRKQAVQMKVRNPCCPLAWCCTGTLRWCGMDDC